MGEVWSSILHSPLTAAMRKRDSQSESFAPFLGSVVCKSKDFETSSAKSIKQHLTISKFTEIKVLNSEHCSFFFAVRDSVYGCQVEGRQGTTTRLILRFSDDVCCGMVYVASTTSGAGN